MDNSSPCKTPWLRLLALFTCAIVVSLAACEPTGPSQESTAEASTDSGDETTLADKARADAVPPETSTETPVQEPKPDEGANEGVGDRADGGTKDQGAPDTTPSSKRPNILLLILDDFGLDASAFYRDKDGDGKPDDNRSYASTPTLDGICKAGVTFMNAWATPLCSSTRATILTGRFGFRTGIGGAIPRGGGIRPSELTIPKLLDQAKTGYAHANMGKWHLGNNRQLGQNSAPNRMGWSHYAGSLSGSLASYTNWQKITNGQESTSTTYATTDVVNDAIDWLKKRDQKKPWFLWMAFNAPHTPFHLPPKGLHSQGDLPTAQNAITRNPGPYFRAAVEAIDTEVKRLLAWLKAQGMLENTVILFLGDNGSPNQVLEPPYQRRRAKGSLYQGGIHIPMCAQGPVIKTPGRKINSAVNTADLFATFLEIAGVQLAQEIPKNVAVDGKSFLSLLKDPNAKATRTWNFSQSFKTTAADSSYALQIGTFKLLQLEKVDALFDLSGDPLETKDLLANGADKLTAPQKKAYDELKKQLQTLLAP